jgi:hypothetical protein
MASLKITNQGRTTAKRASIRPSQIQNSDGKVGPEYLTHSLNWRMLRGNLEAFDHPQHLDIPPDDTRLIGLLLLDWQREDQLPHWHLFFVHPILDENGNPEFFEGTGELKTETRASDGRFDSGYYTFTLLLLADNMNAHPVRLNMEWDGTGKETFKLWKA